MKILHQRFLFLFTLVAQCICNANGIAPEDTYFKITINEIPLKLQLALNDSERSKGLMYREILPEDHGMLFLFEQPKERSFWMYNTQIPLDLAYFNSSGRLLEIYPLHPYEKKAVSSKSQEVLIAVEMNRGWFERNNIKRGAKLDIEALVHAVRSRGHKVSNYQLEAD